MTQTNTDYLLQITPAATDRTFAATGANGDAGRFDDHLSQAATSSSDDSHSRDSSSQRAETARYDRHDRSWNTGASNASSRDDGSSSQTLSADHEQPADVVSGSKPSSENANLDNQDNEESDDTTAAEVAGASQVATSPTRKSDPKTEPNTNSDIVAVAKAAVVSKKAATGAGNRKTAGNTDSQATSVASSTDVLTQHANEAAKLTANAATDAVETNEDADKSQATGSDGMQSKTTKNDASTEKSKKDASASNYGALRKDSPAEGAGTGEISSDVVQKVIDRVDASATLAEATITKDKSETDESSNDDSRTESQNDTRTFARNEASVQANKLDTAQLAVSAASPTDTSVNGASKSKDDEHATKPITSKTDAAAAAFARMTRNSIAGSNDSTSSANDLPQVDPSRFIGRVAKAIQTAQDRGGTLQLRLSPPELGALRIELNVKDGVMSALLQTENANARRLLLDHLPVLRDRLAEHNIRVDRFDVDVRREGTGGQTDTRGSQQQQFQHQPDEPAPRRQAQPQPRTRETAPPEKTVIGPIVSDAGLNLII
jgi:flagellar hook-length control protein FliK